MSPRALALAAPSSGSLHTVTYRCIPSHTVTCRYIPLSAVTCRYSTIFGLALSELDAELSEVGASLLVMAIIGGALVTPLMGLLSDLTGSVRVAFIVPALCFVGIALFAHMFVRPDAPTDVEKPGGGAPRCEGDGVAMARPSALHHECTLDAPLSEAHT